MSTKVIPKISAKGLTEEKWVTTVFGKTLDEEQAPPKVIVTKGGPTSGNFGHAGRPGKIGGSAPGNLDFSHTVFNSRTKRIFDEIYLPQLCDMYFENNGIRITPDEYKAQYKEQIDDVMKDIQVSTRMTAYGLMEVLNDDKFRTVFETQSSGAGVYDEKPKMYLKHRREAEAALMDIDKKQIEDRPIYGYLTHDSKGRPDDSGLDQYGDVAIYFNDDVKDRTTYVNADSLDDAYLGNPFVHTLQQLDESGKPVFDAEGKPVKEEITYSDYRTMRTDPKFDSGRAIPQPVNNPNIYADIYVSGNTDVLSFYNDRKAGKDSQMTNPDTKYVYWEAQIHGGPTSKDIKKVIFTKHPPLPELVKLLDEKGIPWEDNSDIARLEGRAK